MADTHHLTIIRLTMDTHQQVTRTAIIWPRGLDGQEAWTPIV